jgi:hypothetical protein
MKKPHNPLGAIIRKTKNENKSVKDKRPAQLVYHISGVQ